MRKIILAAAFAGYVGAASAGGVDRTDAGYYGDNDYSARVYYRVDFGGPVAPVLSMGLRFDNGSHVATLPLTGFALAGPALNEDDNRKGGWWTSLNPTWVVLGIAGIVVLAAAAGSGGSNGQAPTGTGGG